MSLSSNLTRAKQDCQIYWAAVILSGLCMALLAPPLVAQLSPDQTPGRTILLTLYPWGFEPDEVTIAPGPTSIQMLNRVGFPELRLHIELDQGPAKAKVNLLTDRFEVERPKWSNVFNLAPGTYEVSVEPHAKWVARITVKDERK